MNKFLYFIAWQIDDFDPDFFSRAFSFHEFLSCCIEFISNQKTCLENKYLSKYDCAEIVDRHMWADQIATDNGML